jgi:hypothetical protein
VLHRDFCPISGRELRIAQDWPTIVAMPDAELIARVVASTGLTSAEATRLVSDVVAYYAETTEDFVRRRHAALKLRGKRNDEIFEQIAAELDHRVVAAPRLTSRQLRRIIYG